MDKIVLNRNIYQKLMQWKWENSGHVLELSGARQVGKTYILEKFAKENFNHYIYINCVESTGRDLVKELSKIVLKEDSSKVGKRAIRQAISWPHASRVIGYADKSIDCNHLNILLIIKTMGLK